MNAGPPPPPAPPIIIRFNKYFGLEIPSTKLAYNVGLFTTSREPKRVHALSYPARTATYYFELTTVKSVITVPALLNSYTLTVFSNNINYQKFT